jgi:hypothetical protein
LQAGKTHRSELGPPKLERALPLNQGYAGTGASKPGYRNTKYEVTVIVKTSKYGVNRVTGQGWC